jgi:hypothetical protein
MVGRGRVGGVVDGDGECAWWSGVAASGETGVMALAGTDSAELLRLHFCSQSHQQT